MIGFGMASSHGRSLWRAPELWAGQMKTFPAGVIEQFPKTAKRELEDLDYAKSLYARGRRGFETLRDKLAAYKPDVLLMLGDDQGDMYNMANNPTFSIYTGSDDMWGRSGQEPDRPGPERPKVTFRNHVELSQLLLKGLIKRGFDMANSAVFDPVGAPGIGLSHMAARTVPEVDPEGKLPIVCVFINEYYPPLPSAKRCMELGRAISDVLADRPERVAIYASGGLSHYPGKLNRGYVDIPLDTWILERIERNDTAALEHLFTFDSDNMRAGAGEIRAWLSVAAAMNRPGKVIDYMPVHSGQTGVAFAYWPGEGAA